MMSTATTQMPTAPIALSEGDSAPEATVGPITRVDIARYAGAGGDFNPIHLDEEFARAAGMPSVFSHGLLSAGVLGQYLARWVGLANVRSFGVRFTGQVWPGDSLTFAGKVAHVEDDDGRLAHLELTAARQTGDVVVRGRAAVQAAQPPEA
jgi:acyl dehydratase